MPQPSSILGHLSLPLRYLLFSVRKLPIWYIVFHLDSVDGAHCVSQKDGGWLVWDCLRKVSAGIGREAECERLQS